MSIHRAALRFVAVILATSAVACGGAPGDVETSEEREAYTLEQYRKSMPVQAAAAGVGDETPSMQCSDVPDRCCTDSGFCCTWGNPSGPVCY